MRHRIVYPLFACCWLSFFCAKHIAPDDNPGYQFPLKTGNYWRYCSLEEKVFSGGADTIRVYDTLVLSVKDSVHGSWRAVEFLYITKTKRDSSIVWFLNSDSGLIVTDYTILAGRMPLPREDTGIPNDTVLLLPSGASHAKWTYNDKSFEAGKDTVLDWNGTQLTCSRINCFGNTALISTLFYGSIGIVEKTYTPEIIVNGPDTVRSAKALTLVRYACN